MKQIELRVLKEYLTDSVDSRRSTLRELYNGMRVVRGENSPPLNERTQSLVAKFREVPATPERWTADSVILFLDVNLYSTHRDPDIVFQWLVDLCGGSR